MNKIDPYGPEMAELRRQHQPRAELRHALRLAETALMAPCYDLAVWCGLDQQMEVTSQQTRDRHGPMALVAIDKALADLHSVRDKLAEQLGADAATRQDDVELDDKFAPGGQFADEPPRYLVVDVLREKNTPFVLDSALREFSAEQRSQAQYERDSDPDDTTAASRIEWADAADQLLARIDKALDSQGQS